MTLGTRQLTVHNKIIIMVTWETSTNRIVIIITSLLFTVTVGSLDNYHSKPYEIQTNACYNQKTYLNLLSSSGMLS